MLIRADPNFISFCLRRNRVGEYTDSSFYRNCHLRLRDILTAARRERVSGCPPGRDNQPTRRGYTTDAIINLGRIGIADHAPTQS